MKELTQILEFRANNPELGGILATLVHVSGSSYRRPGARMYLHANGIRVGSISGGCLEEDIILRAAEVSRTGIASTITYDTTSENDLVWGVGLGCHGIVDVLLEKLPALPTKWEDALRENMATRRPTSLSIIYRGSAIATLGTALAVPSTEQQTGVFNETIAPPFSLVIFGAGEDAKPLTLFASELGWHVTIADPRPGMATADRFPAADRVEIIRLKDGIFDLSRLLLEPGGGAVIMTHHYVHDRPLLAQLAATPLSYLGLLGPKKRALQILGDLETSGHKISADVASRLHAPVGLDIGAETPEEVALSILAEIQARLAGRTPIHLSERQLPIHG